MTVHGENDLEQKAWNWFGMPFEHFREPFVHTSQELTKTHWWRWLLATERAEQMSVFG